MLIACHHCKARVNAKVHGEHESGDTEGAPFWYRITLLECTTCRQTLVGLQDQHTETDGPEWSDAIRIWPAPSRFRSFAIPLIVHVSLEEADRCFQAGAYSATAVMCGRALEGICVHFKTKSKTLFTGLKELRDSKVIDERLFTWGDELRKVRNLGAHASTEKVSRDDAEDVLNFVHAICDYVFVLSRRFENFISRRPAPDATGQTPKK